MRRLAIDADDVAAILRHPEARGADPAGRPRVIGDVRGRRIRVILGLDDDATVVSVHEYRRGGTP